jgi:hypothetical protein
MSFISKLDLNKYFSFATPAWRELPAPLVQYVNKIALDLFAELQKYNGPRFAPPPTIEAVELTDFGEERLQLIDRCELGLNSWSDYLLQPRADALSRLNNLLPDPLQDRSLLADGQGEARERWAHMRENRQVFTETLRAVAQGIELRTVCAQIKEGRALLTAIFNHQAEHGYVTVDVTGVSEEEIKEKLQCVVWALMFEAIVEGDEFTEGTFSIWDPEGRLNTFMNSSYAYERPSSHFQGRSLSRIGSLFSKILGGTWQKGLDLENLPSGKRTILFDQVDPGTQNQLTFIKPENYGVRRADHLLWHSWEFVESNYSKLMHPGKDDATTNRKERVPIKPFLEPFKKLIKVTEGEESRGRVLQAAKKHGVAFIDKYLNSLDSRQIAGAQEHFNLLMHNLMQASHATIRTGNEVIILPSAFHSNSTRALMLDTLLDEIIAELDLS